MNADKKSLIWTFHKLQKTAHKLQKNGKYERGYLDKYERGYLGKFKDRELGLQKS